VQSGDFIVDPATLDIVTQRRESSRWVADGARPRRRRVLALAAPGLATEARYTFARARSTARTFAGPSRIDLSGLQATSASSIRY
jgi:hypothetical protein